MSSADDREDASSAAPSQRREPFPRPWSRGASTSDGEPIHDANGELVMMVTGCTSDSQDDEELQKLIVHSVNAMDKVEEFIRNPDGKRS